MVKSPKKSGTKKRKQVSKDLPSPYSRRKSILYMLTAELMPYTIGKKLGISNQLLWKDFQWLKQKKWIIDVHPKQNKYKYYILSELGKQMLDGFERTEKKKAYKIENARHKTIIRNSEYLRSFIKKPEYQFKRNKKFRNVKAYFGRIQGWSVSLFIGKETSLIITPPPLYAKNMMEAHVKSNQNMLDYCNNLNKKWNFDLTLPVPTMHRQYTIPDNFAKKMLEETGGSQLKLETKEGIVSIDQSKGLEERIEFTSAESAQDYLEVPDILRKLKDEVHQSTKISHQMQLLLSNVIENNNKSMNNLTDVFRKAFGIELNGAKPNTEKTKPINDDSARMFG